MTPPAAPTRPPRGPALACLLLGLAMGRVVLAMATHRPGDAFALVMSVVFLGAGSAAMVSWQLGRSAETLRAPAWQAVPGWLLAIGAGVLTGLCVEV
jgi:hypothetical protein